MAKAKNLNNAYGQYAIMCPGCKTQHEIATKRHPDNPPVWSFNGNVDLPTFNPSLLVTTGKYVDPNYNDDGHPDFNSVCHSFIKDGKIQFLSDCTHKLKGQTVELPDIC